MVDPGSGSGAEQGVARGVVVLVVLGTVLGLAYNYAGLKSQPAFGVAWISEPRVLESVEDTWAEGAVPASAVPAVPGAPAVSPEIPDADEPRQIQTAGVKRLFDSRGALIVDARETALYEAGHIPGAVSLPYEEANPDRIDALDPGGRPIIAYCDGGSCELSMNLAWDMILEGGHKKVLVYMGGFPEWQKAGFPVETGAATLASASAARPSKRIETNDPMFFGAAQAEPALPAIPEMDRPMSMELATVKQFYDAGAAFLIDARETEEFVEGHIPGAVNLPYEEIQSDPGRLLTLDPGDKPIIAYCGGGACEVSITVADALIEAGYRRVLIYTGGFPEWERAGYPVARGEIGEVGEGGT
jgi:rhodanese-related sulfurtransferase